MIENMTRIEGDWIKHYVIFKQFAPKINLPMVWKLVQKGGEMVTVFKVPYLS